MKLSTLLREEGDEIEFSSGEDGGEMTAVEANPEAGEAGAQMQSVRSIIDAGLEEIGQAMKDGYQDHDADLQDAIVDRMTAEILDLFVDAPEEEPAPEEGAEEEPEPEM